MSGDYEKSDIFDKLSDLVIGKEDAGAGIRLWANQACVIDVRSCVAGSDLYASYLYWADQMGAPVCTERSFLIHLADQNVPKTVRNGKRLWLGIKVRPEFKGDPAPAEDKPAKKGELWKQNIQSAIGDWLQERCDTTSESAKRSEEWSDDLYRDFESWSKSQIGRVAFGTALSEYKDIWCHPRQHRVIGGQTYQRTKYSGLKLLNRPTPIAAPAKEKNTTGRGYSDNPLPPKIPNPIQPADNFYRDDPVPDDWDEEL